MRLHSDPKRLLERNRNTSSKACLKASKNSICLDFGLRKLLCSTTILNLLSFPPKFRNANKWGLQILFNFVNFFILYLFGEIFSSRNSLLDTVRSEGNKLLLDCEAYKKRRVFVYAYHFKDVFKMNVFLVKRSEISTVFSSGYNIRHKELNKYSRCFSFTSYKLRKKFNEKTRKFENIFPLIYSQKNLENA